MESTLAWLDHREENRRQMREGIGLFRKQGAVNVVQDDADANIRRASDLGTVEPHSLSAGLQEVRLGARPHRCGRE